MRLLQPCRLLVPRRQVRARGGASSKLARVSRELAEKDLTADEMAKVIKMWRADEGGVALLDEVDLLLHPLKSELNFPIGDKHKLDFSPERWTCAIHALDAVFYLERKSMSVPFHQSGRAHKILDELQKVIEEGYSQRALQRSPLPLDGRPACQLARAWRKRSCLLLCGGAVLQDA